MSDAAFREFEAQTLFCPRCRRPVAVRKKLLLVLPTGNQYDYLCQECGTAVGAKVDRDATAFHQTSRAAAAAARPRPPNAPPALGPRRGG